MPSVNKMRINGVDYDITGLDNYSTEEQRVGTWIDGKPLYRKVIVTTLPIAQNNTSGTIDIAIATNIDNAFYHFGYFVTNNRNLPIPWVADGDHKRQTCWITSDKQLHLVNEDSSYNNDSVTLCVEYTKTTDTVQGGNV